MTGLLEAVGWVIEGVVISALFAAVGLVLIMVEAVHRWWYEWRHQPQVPVRHVRARLFVDAEDGRGQD